MRRLALSIATLAALAAAPLVHAAEPQGASAQQMSEIAGEYQLSDGRRLHVDFDGTEAWVRIGKQERRLLDGSRDGRFATVDGKLVLHHTIVAGATTVAVTLHEPSRSPRQGPLLALR